MERTPPHLFSLLPLDVAVQCLLGRLSAKELAALRKVCHGLKNMCDRDELWKPLFEAEFEPVCSDAKLPSRYSVAYFFYAKQNKLANTDNSAFSGRFPFQRSAVSQEIPPGYYGDLYKKHMAPVTLTSIVSQPGVCFRPWIGTEGTGITTEDGRPFMITSQVDRIEKYFYNPDAEEEFDYSDKCKEYDWRWPYISRRMLRRILSPWSVSYQAVREADAFRYMRRLPNLYYQGEHSLRQEQQQPDRAEEASMLRSALLFENGKQRQKKRRERKQRYQPRK